MFFVFFFLMLNELHQCFQRILGNDDQKRNETVDFIKTMSNNEEFARLMGKYLLCNDISNDYKLICLIVFINCNVVFPPDMFNDAFLLFKINDERIITHAAILLSKHLTNPEQIRALLNNNIETLLGCLLTLNEYLRENSLCANEIVMFCASIIANDYHPNFKGLATLSIKYMITPGKNEDPNPAFFPLVGNLFGVPISEENIQILDNIFETAKRILPAKMFLNQCLSHFFKLVDFTPFPIFLFSFASNIIFEIASMIMEELNETYEIQYNEEDIAKCAIICSLLPDYIINRWDDSVVDFFSDNIGDCEYDINDDNDIFFLRKNLADIASRFLDVSVKFCLDIMNNSPYHMEAAYFILSQILPYDYPEVLDLVQPPDDKPLLLGRYFVLLSRLKLDIDIRIIDECINSESYILLILTAYAILQSSLFLSRTKPIVAKLINMYSLLDSPECANLLSMIKMLISKNPEPFIPDIEELSKILLHILHLVVPNRLASIEIIGIFDILNHIGQISPFIQKICFPVIESLLQNGLYYNTGLDFLSGLLSPMEQINPEIYNEIDIMFNCFIRCISTIDQFSHDEMMPIMQIFIFYARTGKASIVNQYFSIMTSNDNIESKYFSFLPSLIANLFPNLQNEERILLLKSLFARLAVSQKSRSYKFSLVLSFSLLVLIDLNNIVSCLNAIGIDIKTFLPDIADIIEEADPVLFDHLIIFAALFKLGHIIVNDNEEEKPYFLVALRLFTNFFMIFIDNFKSEVEEQGLLSYIKLTIDDDSNFSKEDPFYKYHPFKSLPFDQYMNNILPGLDQIPESFRKDIHFIISKFYPVQS